MFGFGKRKKEGKRLEEEQKALVPQPIKTKKGMDRLIMGAIIGVAVGSVVGMAVAPHKGEDARKFVTGKGKEALEKGRAMGQKIIEINQTKKPQKTFSGFLKKLFQKKSSRKIFKNQEGELKKIPHEIEEI